MRWANDMKTPICDFVRGYAESGKTKLHMPGHKGTAFLGIEHLDITEIAGADSLYEADGIISQSEANASELFCCDTYYSTEGSSQCIKAMIYLISLYAKQRGEKPTILAGRNAHKAFHSAISLLDVDVEWIYPTMSDNYLSCNIDADELSGLFEASKPTALYITSPDYLGNIANIASISEICRKNDVLLAIDNAHGAYLKFLSPSQHPMDLGADICCDSAHKTLPVLTGGAYLHINGSISELLSSHVKDAMMLFGSTSPSYLILQSLDMANVYLEGYRERLSRFVPKVNNLKARLMENGYSIFGDELLKITLKTKSYGYFGTDFAKILEEKGIVCEFSDPDFVVMMFTPEVSSQDFENLENVLLSIPKREEIHQTVPAITKLKRIMSLREAVLSPSESLPIEECVGRVVATTSVGCPPAVPLAVAGEEIDESSVSCFKYYNIKKCNVVCK